MPAFLEVILTVLSLTLATLAYLLWRRNAELRRALMQTQTELGLMRAEVDRRTLEEASTLQVLRHDLKTPITSILGFSALLSESQMDARSQRFCQAIQMGTRQLLQVAESIDARAQAAEGGHDATGF